MDTNLVVWHFSIVYVGTKGNLRFMCEEILENAIDVSILSMGNLIPTV